VTLLLDTPRLTVRDYAAADLDDVAEILADPAVFWWETVPFDRDRARRWLDDEMGLAARDGTGRRAVVLKASGKVIGGAGLVWRELEGDREIELGYHLHHAYWGRGYATEAGAACLEHARRIGLRRVVSLIYVDNRRSEAVARRLGMGPEREITWAGLPHRVWALELPPARRRLALGRRRAAGDLPRPPGTR
jgi:RimJ/RimL family protein N-acetyltransferase